MNPYDDPCLMQASSVGYPVLSDDCSPDQTYQTFVDVVALSAIKVGIPSLAMLSMVNKETREKVAPLLKRSLKKEGFVYPESLRKLLLFDANGHYMTIQHVIDGAFKVQVAGVTYLLLKDYARVTYVNANGTRYGPAIGICETFPQIIKALNIQQGMRRASKRHGIPVKMPSLWFENIDNTPEAQLNRFSLKVHADLKQTELMADGRRWFDKRYRLYDDFRPGKGVKLELLLRCIKFD